MEGLSQHFKILGSCSDSVWSDSRCRNVELTSAFLVAIAGSPAKPATSMTSSPPLSDSTATEAVRVILSEQPGPVFVHSGLVKVIGGVRGSGDRRSLLEAHCDLIFSAADGRNVWMPSFNYDFTKVGKFLVRRDPSQVGALSEHFRTTRAEWRSSVPVFSVAGSGPTPTFLTEGRIDPFGSESAFSQIAGQNGTILLYGTTLETFTFRHYVERLVGGPLYRYDKVFPGTILDDLHEWDVELVYHVKPLNSEIRYDHVRLAWDLTQRGLLKHVKLPRFTVMAVAAFSLRDFWREQLLRDPLYFLDDDSRQWVQSQLHRLGRRFVISDFESPVSGH